MRLLSIGVLFLLFVSCSKKDKKENSYPIQKVETAKVLKYTIPQFLEAIGHVKAFNSAEIRAQVEGRLIKNHYTQGSIASKDELLITIDPSPYEAQLQQAQGAVIESQSQLNFAREKVERYTRLVKDEYVSKLNYDEYVTSVETLLGTIKKQEGILADAKVNLSYCYIKAPFKGRIGKKLIDEGNLIPNAGLPLVTIQQTQPIYVDFPIPERYLSKFVLKQKQEPLKVLASIPQTDVPKQQGELIVIDNIVDKSTGMIAMRGQFINETDFLWPGQFVKVRLILDVVQNALLVPEEALNYGQNGFYVLTVDKSNVVGIKDVKVGENLNGVFQVLEGLSVGEIVITNGQINARVGNEVEPISLDESFLTKIDIW